MSPRESATEKALIDDVLNASTRDDEVKAALRLGQKTFTSRKFAALLGFGEKSVQKGLRANVQQLRDAGFRVELPDSADDAGEEAEPGAGSSATAGRE
jgi:biotin operon repressor